MCLGDVKSGLQWAMHFLSESRKHNFRFVIAGVVLMFELIMGIFLRANQLNCLAQQLEVAANGTVICPALNQVREKYKKLLAEKMQHQRQLQNQQQQQQFIDLTAADSSTELPVAKRREGHNTIQQVRYVNDFPRTRTARSEKNEEDLVRYLTLLVVFHLYSNQSFVSSSWKKNREHFTLLGLVYIMLLHKK